MDRLEYFAAANSADGFFNMFGEIFSDVDKLYIIKGGPGTGKSSFMRKIATRTQDKGFHTELIYCSSDPSSLDGVIFEQDGRRVAIADGTAPHLLDMKQPGVRDEIINLGDNWDSKVIESQSERIEILNRYKSACWDRAYRLLSAAGECEKSADSALLPCVDMNVISEAVRRIAEAQKAASGGGRVFRSFFGRANSMHGEVCVDCFGGNVKAYRPVSNYYGTGRLFLSELAKASRNCGVPIIEIKYPLLPDKTDGVYFCGSHELYLIENGKRDGEKYRYIGMKPAVSAIAFRGVRGGVRFALSKCRELTSGALEQLERAGEYHAELESIYKGAMDFEKNNKLCGMLCEKLNI